MKNLFSVFWAALLCMTLFAPGAFASSIAAPAVDFIRHPSTHPVDIGVTVAERSIASGRDPDWRGFESRPSPLYPLGWQIAWAACHSPGKPPAVPVLAA